MKKKMITDGRTKTMRRFTLFVTKLIQSKIDKILAWKY